MFGMAESNQIQTNTREMRGYAIIVRGSQIRSMDAKTYRVNSQSGNGSYLVIREGSERRCECPDHMYRGVESSISLRSSSP